MQPGYNRTHGSSLSLTETLVEAALQGKLSHALLLLDHGAHLKESIGRANILVAGGITTANCNLLLGLLDDLEVVGDDGADFVVVCEKVLAAPQMGGGFGTLVLIGEEGALDDVA